ncbi:hypothetical protein [Salinibaculum rarum]|uniref:hypothetical protein n=1 Tax=Salinibaculum rarum TaxID=3058903 RepID=UPI00265DB910|nr:hypothetical protein [Salinibaculum sp. KK48]
MTGDQTEWTTGPRADTNAQVAAFEERYGFRPPDTYWKDIGYDVLLNADAKLSPSIPAERKDQLLVIWFRKQFDFAVFIPRESGTIVRHQTDGKLMKHPEMEGTLVPLDPPADPRLPDAWGTPAEYDPRAPWAEIKSWFPFEFEDVPAPDGLAQNQEGIRWIQVVEIHDSAYASGPQIDESGEVVGIDERYRLISPWQWLDMAAEQRVALFYQNCD